MAEILESRQRRAYRQDTLWRQILDCKLELERKRVIHIAARRGIILSVSLLAGASAPILCRMRPYGRRYKAFFEFRQGRRRGSFQSRWAMDGYRKRYQFVQALECHEGRHRSERL